MATAVLPSASPPATSLSYTRRNNPLAISATTISSAHMGAVGFPEMQFAGNPTFPPSNCELNAHSVVPGNPSPSSSRSDMIFSPDPNMASIPAQQNYPFFNGHDLLKREVEHPTRTSGTTASDDSNPEVRASGSVDHTESDPEADVAGPADQEFQHTVYDPTVVKNRRRTTAAQLEILNAHFAESPKPDMGTRRFLSKQLGMTVREVQVWFQNRRAKQKKIDSRAQSYVGRAPSHSDISPVFLTAPQLFSSSSYASSNGYSGYSTQSAPSLAPPSSYGNGYTPSSYGSIYSEAQKQQASYGVNMSPYEVNMSYYSSGPQPPAQPIQPPYQQQQQQSYFPDVRSNYVPSSYGYAPTAEETALSPKSYFAAVQAFGGNNGQDRWSPNQSHFTTAQAQDGQDSVSPVSSRGSSHDESAYPQRRRSMIPHALSNLSGLSIMPTTEEFTVPSSTMEPIYLSGASNTNGVVMPIAPHSGLASPLYEAIAAPDFSAYQQALQPTFEPILPRSGAIVSSGNAQPGMHMSGVPAFANGPANIQPYASAMNPPGPFGNTSSQPVNRQRVLPFGTKQNSLALPLASTEAVLQMSAGLAARRQSMASYPDQGERLFTLQPLSRDQLNQQQQPIQIRQSPQNRQEMLSSIPKNYNLFDESALPLRRASTSVLQNNAPPRQMQQQMQQHFNRPDPLAASRQALLDDEAQSVLPILASSPTILNHQQEENGQANSPARNSTRTSTSTINSALHFEDLPILGGLRRGSIPKKIKGATTTYSPYPQIHLRNHSNSTMANSQSILQE